MKNYEKPVLLVNEELAEGVYAASGSIHWNLSVSTEGGVGNIHEAVVSKYVLMIVCKIFFLRSSNS